MYIIIDIPHAKLQYINFVDTTISTVDSLLRNELMFYILIVDIGRPTMRFMYKINDYDIEF